MQAKETYLASTTWTVHTSAKARHTSVAIRIPIGIRDPHHHQNLVFVHWPIANLP